MKKCLNCGKGITDGRATDNHPRNPKLYCSRYCNTEYHRHNLIGGTSRVSRLPKDYTPSIDEIRTGTELQLIKDFHVNQGCKYQWLACEHCGIYRWVGLNKKGERAGKVCAKCVALHYFVGAKSTSYKGGSITKGGYRMIALDPLRDSFWIPMAVKQGNNRRRILEHRIVMARHIGRCLQFWEDVHHKNGDKLDNRIDNLELLTRGSHSSEHSKGYRDGYQRGFIDGSNTQIKDLKDQVKLLQWQIKDLRGIYETH